MTRDPNDLNRNDPKDLTPSGPRRRATAAIALAATGLVMVLVAACSGGDSGSVSELSGTTAVDRDAVLAGLVDDVIVPGYQQVATSTAALAAATTTLCAGVAAGAVPTAADLTAARQAWDDARTAWRSTEAYRYGPAATLRAASAIAYPTDATKIDKLLAANEPPTPFTTASLGGRGADVRGLGAMEAVLFSPGAPGDLDARRCSYLDAAAQLVNTSAAATAAAWTTPTGGQPAFAEQMKHPGNGGMYADTQGVIEDVVNGSISALTAVADMRLGRAAGDITGTPEPATVDAGLAHRTLEDVEAILHSVQAVVAGNPSGSTENGAAGKGGLGALVGELSGPTRTRLVRQLEDAVAANAAIPPPLAAMDEAALASVQDAYQLVRAARVTFRTQVASMLGITLSFSDSDGDT